VWVSFDRIHLLGEADTHGDLVRPWTTPSFWEEGRQNRHKIRLLQVVVRRVRRARTQQEAEEEPKEPEEEVVAAVAQALVGQGH